MATHHAALVALDRRHSCPTPCVPCILLAWDLHHCRWYFWFLAQLHSHWQFTMGFVFFFLRGDAHIPILPRELGCRQVLAPRLYVKRLAGLDSCANQGSRFTVPGAPCMESTHENLIASPEDRNDSACLPTSGFARFGQGRKSAWVEKKRCTH